ncbi:hypothetical protein FQN57_006576 [Myotisia sp. PD_48]|nr:hypothetical protein FQN57_006576 [Myotisia sp. PD_48]
MTTFYQFQKLPSELRIKVWEYAISDLEPRLVNIICEKCIAPTSTSIRYTKFFWSPTPVPAILHVNREARYEAQKIYEQHFRTEYSNRYIYVSFSKDKIRLVDNVLLHLPEPAVNNIQALCIKTIDYMYFGAFNMEIIKRMRLLTDLEIELAGTDRPTDGLMKLLEDFEEAVALDPMWKNPNVQAFSVETGNEMFLIRAKILTGASAVVHS